MNMQIYSSVASLAPSYGVKSVRDSSLNVSKCADNTTSATRLRRCSQTELLNIINNSPASLPLKRTGVADHTSSEATEEELAGRSVSQTKS